MFKILIISRISRTNTSVLETNIVEFETRKEANRAVSNIQEFDDNVLAISIKTVKLY